MGVFTKLTKSQIKKILSHYSFYNDQNFSMQGIGLGTVNTYYKLTFADKSCYFLKIDEVGDQKRLDNELRVFRCLSKNKNTLGFDFPFPLKTKTKKLHTAFQKKPVLLFPELAGRSRFNDLKPADIKQIGSAMASLHKAKLAKTIKNHRFCLSGLIKSFKQIEKKLNQKHPELSALIKTELTQLKTKLPKNAKAVLIHGDLFPENIHWSQTTLSGILDFEAAGKGHALFDFCVGLHALCHNGKNFDLKKVRALQNGYQKISKTNLLKHRDFPIFLRLTTLRFLITRLKDFELPGIVKTTENFKDYKEYINRFNSLNTLTRISPS